MVEDDLYRSGQPNELNFPFLEKLQLKTVIWLAPDEPSEAFQNFLDELGIETFHLGMSDHHQNPWNPVSEDMVIEALAMILDKSHYPLYVCCNLGRHRTGTVIGCLRKFQRWNLTSILDEYRRYAGQKVRLLNEQFMELFDTDLVSAPNSDNAPDWL
jgi:tyrosine-protein phosphatase OCA1